MKVVSKNSMFGAVLLGSLLVLFAAFALDRAHAQQPASPQKQPPNQQPPKKSKEAEEEEGGQVLKVGTKLVNVLFSVTDKQNRYLENLTKEDLEITENGQPQEIFTFKRNSICPHDGDYGRRERQ
ncbi:MAG: hypothetical protein U0Y68_05525 [Blastocatellia bacterium]